MVSEGYRIDSVNFQRSPYFSSGFFPFFLLRLNITYITGKITKTPINISIGKISLKSLQNRNRPAMEE